MVCLYYFNKLDNTFNAVLDKSVVLDVVVVSVVVVPEDVASVPNKLKKLAYLVVPKADLIFVKAVSLKPLNLEA